MYGFESNFFISITFESCCFLLILAEFQTYPFLLRDKSHTFLQEKRITVYLSKVRYLDKTRNDFPLFAEYHLCDVSVPPYSAVTSGFPSRRKQNL